MDRVSSAMEFCLLWNHGRSAQRRRCQFPLEVMVVGISSPGRSYCRTVIYIGTVSDIVSLVAFDDVSSAPYSLPITDAMDC